MVDNLPLIAYHDSGYRVPPNFGNRNRQNHTKGQHVWPSRPRCGRIVGVAGTTANAEIALKSIAIFYQGRKKATSELASQLAPMLQQQGYNVHNIDLRNEIEEPTVINGWGEPNPLLKGSDMVIVLGGDGTILHAARLCAFSGTPILGVNFGRVGFLTELEPDELAARLPSYLERDTSIWIDKRTMLHAVLVQDERSEEFLALNDIVIARGKWPRLVKVGIWVDDYYYTTSYADGIILSTATGSTAYNMAVGGPLLHPHVQSSVLTPIASHLASDRSLILHPEATVKLQIFTGAQNGVFSADGQMNREIKDGATIMIYKSQYVTQFLRSRPPTYFYQKIAESSHL